MGPWLWEVGVTSFGCSYCLVLFIHYLMLSQDGPLIMGGGNIFWLFLLPCIIYSLFNVISRWALDYGEGVTSFGCSYCLVLFIHYLMLSQDGPLIMGGGVTSFGCSYCLVLFIHYLMLSQDGPLIMGWGANIFWLFLLPCIIYSLFNVISRWALDYGGG